MPTVTKIQGALLILASTLSLLPTANAAADSDSSSGFIVESSNVSGDFSPNDVVVNDRLLRGCHKDQSAFDFVRETRVSEQQAARDAFDRMLRQTATLGIQDDEVTQAILEGRFTPRLDDLYFAVQGIGTLSKDVALSSNRHRKRFAWYVATNILASTYNEPLVKKLLDEGVIVTAEQKSPDGRRLLVPEELVPGVDTQWANTYVYLEPARLTPRVVTLIASAPPFDWNDWLFNFSYREDLWNARFGPVESPESLSTVWGGKLRQFAAGELVAEFRQRRESSDTAQFVWYEPVSLFRHVRVEEATTLFDTQRSWYSPGDASKSALVRDYEQIRQQIYIPRLQRLAYEAMAASARQATDSSKGETEAITAVQQILSDAGLAAPGFAVDGTWDDPDEVVVAEYIRSLQSIPDLWNGREVDGRWTPELSLAMQSLLADLDPSLGQVKTWQDFTDSMDFLLEAGIYRGIRQPPLVTGSNMPAVATQNVSPSPTISSNHYWRACVLSWANGFAWEFGDEIIAKLIEREDGDSARAAAFRSQVPDLMNRASDANAIVLMICAMIGYSVSIFGEAAIIAAGLQTERRPIKAFKLGAGIEILEEIVALIGEYSTMGSVNLKAAVLMGGAAAFVTGCMAAAAAGNKKRMQKEVGVSMGIVLLGCFLVWVTFIVNP